MSPGVTRAWNGNYFWQLGCVGKVRARLLPNIPFSTVGVIYELTLYLPTGQQLQKLLFSAYLRTVHSNTAKLLFNRSPTVFTKNRAMICLQSLFEILDYRQYRTAHVLSCDIQITFLNLYLVITLLVLID